MAASVAGDTILDSIKRPPSSSPDSDPSSWLSDEQLSMLHFLFSKNLERALRILDQKGVYRIVGEPSKRVVFQIQNVVAVVLYLKMFALSYQQFQLAAPLSHLRWKRFLVSQVAGESKGNDKYLCFPRHFCSCQSFFFDVVGRGEQLCCKHQLAARIGDALEICQQVTVSDEELAILLLQ